MGESRLRPGEVTDAPDRYAPKGADAYYAIYGAVQSEAGLIHGRLDYRGAHCAIGCYFEHTKQALSYHLIDEVATINDSVPHLTKKQRRTFVLRWLKWKLTLAGMPGFRTTDPPRKAKP